MDYSQDHNVFFAAKINTRIPVIPLVYIGQAGISWGRDHLNFIFIKKFSHFLGVVIIVTHSTEKCSVNNF